MPKTLTGEILPEAVPAAIIGQPDPDQLVALLRRVRTLLKSPDGSSLILDFRVRTAIFEIEAALGGLRHEA